MGELFELSILHLTALLVVSFGGSFVVKKTIKYFPTDGLPQGFKSAGVIIGHLERILIYLLLILELPTLIGFLLTMKAVYRFGDIQGDNDTKMKISEYFIIGTLVSLLWSIVIYIFFNGFVRISLDL